MIFNPVNPEQPQNLAELKAVMMGQRLIPGYDRQVMGKHGGVVPVEASVYEDMIVDDAVFGMNR